MVTDVFVFYRDPGGPWMEIRCDSTMQGGWQSAEDNLVP